MIKRGSKKEEIKIEDKVETEKKKEVKEVKTKPKEVKTELEQLIQLNPFSHHHKHHKKRKIFILLIIIVAVILGIFGTKIYLYLNFLIGNDLIVKLDVNQENFILKHGEEGLLSFKSTVTTNPFCTAYCTTKVEDLSSKTNSILLEETFPLKPALSYKKEVSLFSTEKIGYYLYRVGLTCSSKASKLCHTSEKPTTRKVLITVKYELSDEEKKQLELAGQKITSASQELQEIIDTTESIKASSGFQANELEDEIPALQKELNQLVASWSEQKVSYFNSLLTSVTEKITALNLKAKFIYTELEVEVTSHNQLVDFLANTSIMIQNFGALIVYSPEIDQIVKAINNLKETNNLSSLTGALDEKVVYAIVNKTTLLAETLNLENKEELQQRERKLKILSNGVCGENCFSGLIIKTNSSDPICQKISFFLNDYGNFTLSEKISEPVKLNETITELNLLQTETSQIITENSTILEIIIPCAFNEIKEIYLPEKKFITLIKKIWTFSLPEKTETCCIWGKCSSCRNLSSSLNSETLSSETPIVFLHGHAFDKDISFEYSLEGFNKIQDRMEEDRIINAGAITLYTPKESPSLWGKFGTVSIKGSYYYDIFEEPNNYYVIQTKSENIDTYAIRLKEVIDIITYKTGSPKVKLVAFSMGGLVARRYLQVFGADQVERLVTIGTPHQGIEGEVLKLCSLTGEERECKDMDKTSLFMNKLNRGELPSIPFKIIAGSGCKMDLGDGDGIVLSKNAQLTGAETGIQTTIINGKCRGKTTPLHLDLLDLDLYPEVYTELMEFLR